MIYNAVHQHLQVRGRICKDKKHLIYNAVHQHLHVRRRLCKDVRAVYIAITCTCVFGADSAGVKGMQYILQLNNTSM